jgi:1,4-alpha-glucan branching enzyme
MTSGHEHPLPPHGRANEDRHPNLLRLAVKATTFSVRFRCHAPHAKTVTVVGTFHHGARHPMRRAVDGCWHATLELKRGRYEYRFLVDGVATLDPQSFGMVSHPDGSKSSLLEVGY